ncbi:MAG: hypothetical protein L0Z07_01920, partial [Planctomycetes bacterium]|nr:hypothetical protein [Planctomycetota bacterium]
KFVSVHNSTIDAYVPGASGKVEDFTLQELRALDIGVRVGPEWKGTRIPTLEEILDLCKGKIGIYLDLKQAPIAPLVQLIQERGMEHDVIWFADDAELMDLKRLCRRCVPMPQPNSEAELPALLARFQPRVVASNCDEISENFLKTCHAAGAIVIADETTPAGWQQVLDWGLDGIQTDHPAELIEFLKKRSAAADGDGRR